MCHRIFQGHVDGRSKQLFFLHYTNQLSIARVVLPESKKKSDETTKNVLKVTRIHLLVYEITGKRGKEVRSGSNNR